MKVINMTGVLPSNGRKYKITTALQYDAILKTHFIYVYLYVYHEGLEYFVFNNVTTTRYNKKNYKEKFREAFIKSEQKFGLTLLKPDLKAVS